MQKKKKELYRLKSILQLYINNGLQILRRKKKARVIEIDITIVYFT
jgi:hypothetical protein